MGIVGPDPSIGFRPGRFVDRWSREEAMSPKSQSRRDVLRKAAAISVATSFGGIGTTGAVAATEAVRSAAQRNLDPVLRQAAGSRDIAGVVAAAVTQDGILYEGAFGKRDLAKGTDMTPDSVFWI